jgi:CRP-like cAMP-binding protein/Na+/melibiose symporter-like transporter
MTAPAAAPSMFAIFRKRDFTRLWFAQLISTIGSSLTDLAAAILVFRETQSALAVGLILMASAVPSLIFGLLAGVFVDRFDRKKIMIWSDILRAVLVASIPLAYANGIVWLYVVVFLNAAVAQFFDPAHESVVPEIADEEELAAADAFLSISSFGSTAIGFAAAGLLATSNSLDLAFYVDAASFVLGAVLVSFVTVRRIEADESTTVRAIVVNLKAGLVALRESPILRTTFLTSLPVFFSFGLWNVLLLPFALRALNATEFEYGLQEGLTSVGFVIGSLIMARIADRLREGAWIVGGVLGMGLVGVVYALSPSLFAGLGHAGLITVAIALVTLSGLLNAPASIARRLLMQRNTPRELRGRIFAAFFVGRDVVFLLGMVAAGLADVIDVKLLVLVSSVLLVATAVWMQVTPGIGQPAAEWRRAMQLLRQAPATAAGIPVRAATLADFDRLVRRVPTLGLLDDRTRDAFIEKATVRDAPVGQTVITRGETGSAAWFILDGQLVAGTPTEEGEFRSLSTMGPGDFFGEIAALTGSPRTANVVAAEASELVEVPAETLRSLMAIPLVSELFLSKLTERLGRTTTADLPRLAGLDQRDLRELRTESGPTAEALPKTYAT